MDDDLTILQEVFDSEPAVTCLGAPVDLRAIAAAVRDLRKAAPGQDGQAVADGWKRLSGALGGRLTAALLSGPEWRSFCPISRPLDAYDAGDHSQVVWLSDTQSVVAEAVMAGDGTFLGMKFAVQPR